jgi:acetoin utilization deacetylase AcuC-like enzyme
MRYFFSDRQLSHQPQQYMVHGRIVSPFENRDRVDAIADALEASGLARAEPADTGLDPILAVHADHFLAFLRDAWRDFQSLPNRGPEVLPNVHAYAGATPDYGPRGPARPTGIIGRAGWYMGDLSAVIMAGTYDAAMAAAHAAVAAADAVTGGEDAAFALCRPPGHHAYVDRCSGFCFLNNAAIAAQRLRGRFGRVAILDFDTHHGDGTQAIFYRRDDVFFGSVHTDPSAYYPHFCGYADERGAGAGEGWTLNVPLAFSSDDEAFVDANRRIVEAALARGAEALVISAGWDAHRLDPLSKLAVSDDGFASIGALYGSLGLPTVIVQEGGYSLDAIRTAALAFTAAFRNARGA